MKQLSHTDRTDGGSARWMRLSLGAGVSVPEEEILGIFDMDTATVSPVTKKFLNTAQKDGRVSVVGEELPKSFVVVVRQASLVPGSEHKNKKNEYQAETLVALSQFAPSTLCGRGGSI